MSHRVTVLQKTGNFQSFSPRDTGVGSERKRPHNSNALGNDYEAGRYDGSAYQNGQTTYCGQMMSPGSCEGTKNNKYRWENDH